MFETRVPFSLCSSGARAATPLFLSVCDLLQDVFKVNIDVK